MLFALADCNSFYASCETAFKPFLRGRPVIVLSNNDGCVVARSREAKQLGIAMGAPFFQIREFCRINRVAVFSSNYALYGDMSQRVMQTLASAVPEIEQYSIDEAFLNLTGMRNVTTAFAESIVDRVKLWTGIPISIGIAPTRTLAKVANRQAKMDGVKTCLLLDESKRIDVLKRFPVEEVWGVGRQLSVKLERMGIRSAFDLAQQDPVQIRKRFTVIQEAMVRELNGESCLGNQQSPPTAKSIQTSRSFGKPRYEFDALSSAISTFVSRAAEKLREQGQVARAVDVYIRTSPFRPVAQYSASTVVPLGRPTSDTLLLTQAALDGLAKIFQPNFAYQKAGIILLDLSSAAVNSAQLTFFDDPEELEHRAGLMKTLDRLNEKFGRSAVYTGIQLLDDSWKSVQQNTSPRYTTEWDDLPVAK